MNRLAFISIPLYLSSSVAWAGTAAILPGSMSTTGPSSNHHSLFSATHNPAMADLTIDSDERWRSSYFLSFGTKIELGDVNGFVDELDDLIDILDDPSIATDSVDDTLNRFNTVLSQMGEQGYIKNSTSIYFPGFPLYWRPSFAEGTLFFELGVETQEKLSLIDDELRFNNQNGSFETNSAAYIKSGIEKRISFGYGQEIFEDKLSAYKGKVHGGIKLSIYNMELSKQVFQLQLLDGKDIDDLIKDEYDNNLATTTAIGLDAGVVWVTDIFSLGLTLSNINSPSFDYGDVGIDCEAIQEGTVSRSNCELTTQFTEVAGEIKAQEKHRKNANISVDGTYFILDGWSVSGSMDLAAYDDIVGTQNQMMHISTAYNSGNFWLSSVRLGMQKNLAGSELTSYGLGFSVFSSLSLDLSMSPESIVYDGSETPREFGFSLSFEESF